MYSQNNEESIILSLTGDNGTFIDIGAYDGVTFSNTRALLDKGWRGYLIEPSPSVIPALWKNMKDFHHRVVIIESALTPSYDGEIELHDSGGDAVSTTLISHRTKWSNHATFTTSTVKAISIETLFNRTRYGCDFINIDVEGGNLDILLSLPMQKLNKLSLVCVEHDYHYDKMINFMKGYGFAEVHRNGENLIFHRDVKAE